MTTLGSQSKGFKGIISAVGSSDPTAAPLVRRLLEMGIVEGVSVEIAMEAPFSRDPIAVKVRGALIALRRNEANLICVVPT